jgi:hypothetical protein
MSTLALRVLNFLMVALVASVDGSSLRRRQLEESVVEVVCVATWTHGPHSAAFRSINDSSLALVHACD